MAIGTMFAALIVSGCGGSGTGGGGSGGGEATVQPFVDTEAVRLAAEAKAQEEARRLEAERLAVTHRTNIERVLNEDQQAGRSGTTGAVAAAMVAISLEGTPNDFRSAFVTHTEAWRRAARIDAALQRMKSDEEMSAATAGGILATVFGADVSPFSDHVRAIQRLEEERTVAAEEINTTFATVKSVAVGYGATLPPGA